VCYCCITQLFIDTLTNLQICYSFLHYFIGSNHKFKLTYFFVQLLGICTNLPTHTCTGACTHAHMRAQCTHPSTHTVSLQMTVVRSHLLISNLGNYFHQNSLPGRSDKVPCQSRYWHCVYVCMLVDVCACVHVRMHLPVPVHAWVYTCSSQNLSHFIVTIAGRTKFDVSIQICVVGEHKLL